MCFPSPSTDHLTLSSRSKNWTSKGEQIKASRKETHPRRSPPCNLVGQTGACIFRDPIRAAIRRVNWDARRLLGFDVLRAIWEEGELWFRWPALTGMSMSGRRCGKDEGCTSRLHPHPHSFPENPVRLIIKFHITRANLTAKQNNQLDAQHTKSQWNTRAIYFSTVNTNQGPPANESFNIWF